VRLGGKRQADGEGQGGPLIMGFHGGFLIVWEWRFSGLSVKADGAQLASALNALVSSAGGGQLNGKGRSTLAGPHDFAHRFPLPGGIASGQEACRGVSAIAEFQAVSAPLRGSLR